MIRTEFRTPGILPPVTFSPEEAAAVAVALAARTAGPYAEAGRSALEKALAALEPDPRRRGQLLAGSEEAGARAGREADVRSAVERAVTRRQVLRLHYRDGRGQASRRVVEPQLLVGTGEHWFLVAWCRERSALRWFRRDRIESAEPTGEVAVRRDLAGLGSPPVPGHPAGRRLPRTPAPPGPPRLRLVPGGRA